MCGWAMVNFDDADVFSNTKVMVRNVDDRVPCGPKGVYKQRHQGTCRGQYNATSIWQCQINANVKSVKSGKVRSRQSDTTRQVNINEMPNPRHVNARAMSSQWQGNVKAMPSQCRANFKSMTSVCQVHATSMSTQCQYGQNWTWKRTS